MSLGVRAHNPQPVPPIHPVGGIAVTPRSLVVAIVLDRKTVSASPSPQGTRQVIVRRTDRLATAVAEAWQAKPPVERAVSA
jgi:hypothetical protein